MTAPTPTPPLHVLVSGASGFIAAWVVRALLERGHRVRGTVRSVPKGEYLVRLFAAHADRFAYVIVPDMEKEGAFDDAVRGVDAIVHTASPFHMHADDPQEIIGPAVAGTTSILESARKHAPAVRRVVVTSSTAAVVEIPAPHESATFAEKDWNRASEALVRAQGRAAPQMEKYRASKSLAEQAAWEFLDRHAGEIAWDLVTLQPPYVFGPVIHEVSSAHALNTSNANLLALLQNAPPRTAADLARAEGSYVDVRDVASAHAEALVSAHVAGRSGAAALAEGRGRVTLSAAVFTWQDVVDALEAAGVPLPATAPRGRAGAGRDAVHPVRVDSTRAREVLGIAFRTGADVFGDTVVDFRSRGWVA